MAMTPQEKELVENWIEVAVLRTSGKFSKALDAKMGELRDHVAMTVTDGLQRHAEACPIRSDFALFKERAETTVKTSGVWLRGFKWLLSFFGGGAVGAAVVKLWLM